MLEVKIKEQEKSYPISFENCEICELKEKILEFTGGKNYAVVISQKVAKLYGKTLGFDKNRIFVLKDGEKEKNQKNFERILKFCQKLKLTREDCLIAVGGGVVGDITGFCASVYMRGIKYIQVPTTLLACVDSSVGGKTAINTDFGKNIIGAFWQPSAVVINTKFLKTLNLRELKTGLGEVVKYAFIEKSCLAGDFNLINFLGENTQNIFDYDFKTLEKLIEICIKLKISVVEKDEKENGLRRILNFGHTYGHAVEKLTNYKKYTHGECVVAGIYFAFNLALKNNLIDKNYFYFMQDTLKKFNFRPVPEFEMQKILPVMKTDKKAASNFIRYIMPTDYAVVKEFSLNDLLTIS